MKKAYTVIEDSANKKTNYSYFKEFVYSDIAHISSSVISYHSNREGKNTGRIIKEREKLANFAKSYIKKIQPIMHTETTNRIMDQIDLLKNENPQDLMVLMSAHQPNLFPYSGVLRKIALLKGIEKRIGRNTKSGKQVVSFFGIADHDLVNNTWIKSAEMASPLRKEGMLRFNINIPEKDKLLPTNKILKPPIEKVESWKAQIINCISENAVLATKYAKQYNLENKERIGNVTKANFEEFWSYVEQAYYSSDTLAEFNSFLFALIINEVWGEPVIFANFSDCFTSFGEEYKWLLENNQQYSQIISQGEQTLKGDGVDSGLSPDINDLLPLWIKCSCGSKSRILRTASGWYGRCIHCDKQIEYSDKKLSLMIKSTPELFEPRSISMPISFSRALDMSCYVTGVGALGYLTHSKHISEKLNSPFPPSLFWYVDDKYLNIQTLASALEVGNIAQTYQIDGIERDPRRVAISAKAVLSSFNKKVEDGSIPKNGVSERNRQLLAEIPKSLKIKSCAVDYAINIGLASTYKQWLQQLENGIKLDQTTSLKSVIE